MKANPKYKMVWDAGQYAGSKTRLGQRMPIGRKNMEMTVTEEKNNAIVVSVKGRLDAQTAGEFMKNMAEPIERVEKHLIVDFDALEYISSAGLRVVLATAKKLETKKAKVLIVGLKDTVAAVFKISGFHMLFKIFDTVEAALEQI
jgi:anti-anti-sigma factor